MNTWLILTFLWPAILLLGLAFRGIRPRVSAAIWSAPLPALGLAITFFASGAKTHSVGPLLLDSPGCLLLGAASMLWILAAIGQKAGFANIQISVCWLLTLLGNFGVFLTADPVTFLGFYALVSLPAYGLIVADQSPGSRQAGKVYLGFAILGENILLIAFVLLSAHTPATSPLLTGLLVAGFGMKIGLIPLHFWMPLAYPAAPIFAAAALSGAAVKAGLIGLLRFLPWESPMVTAGEILTALGFAGAFFGVLVGCTQSNPKAILAYSSISQMGFLAAVLGLGLSAGDSGVIILVAFYAAHHAFVKGALFLAIGCAGAGRWATFPALLIGLGLAGLPLTGGSLAKLAVKGPLGSGLTAWLASLAAAGTAMLIVHFFNTLRTLPEATSSRPSRSQLTSWLIAAALALVAPWIALPLAGLTWADVFDPAKLAMSLLPVLLGSAFGFYIFCRHVRLPAIPAGDIFSLLSRAPSLARYPTSMLAKAESFLREWPVACTSLVLILLVLTLALAS